MPDDLVLRLQLDPHSAVVALTYDPKLDDMALLEALKSDAFYVGALGSRADTARRKQRLAIFDLAPHEIARLHGPVGLDLGGRTRRSRCPSLPTIFRIGGEHFAMVRARRAGAVDTCALRHPGMFGPRCPPVPPCRRPHAAAWALVMSRACLVGAPRYVRGAVRRTPAPG
ncbi:XdhC family protein [Xanthomonas graminis]|nr:XdhC family protein [Xanthomonas translucens]UKE76674.1 XdhC family protein [Xanthomonas translucens pv. arrhenatheri]